MSRIPDVLSTTAFDYPLPAELIARHPAPRRDESRLLVLDRETGHIDHRIFRDVAMLLNAGDGLVLNETRVFPGRLLGHKPTGGRAEILLLHPRAGRDFETAEWVALVKPGARLRPGTIIDLAPDFHAEIVAVNTDGTRVLRLVTRGSIDAAIRQHGHVPLPPYIDRDADREDAERYQTVYARETGSVAAPTAGLHFTTALVGEIEARGVRVARIVLHIGPGTFRPVEVEDPADHPMHAEAYDVSAQAAATINDVRASGGRVWAVGTTVVRTLETVAAADGSVHAASGSTTLFIRPGHRFRAVDSMITNFHLPRSTLLMLVSAFAGHEPVMRAYRDAIARRYRFYSYGDAMAVV